MFTGVFLGIGLLPLVSGRQVRGGPLVVAGGFALPPIGLFMRMLGKDPPEADTMRNQF